MLYMSLKLVHVVNAAFLFGTGVGTAYFILRAYLHSRHRGPQSLRVLAVTVAHAVQADWIFTAMSGILQFASGLGLALLAGFPLTGGWLLPALLLFFGVLACWVPAAYLQTVMQKMAAKAEREYTTLPGRYHRAMRVWMLLGVPAFLGMLGIFFLMVFKPG